MIILIWFGTFAVIALVSIIIIGVQCLRDDVKYKRVIKDLRRRYEEGRINTIMGGEPWKN